MRIKQHILYALCFLLGITIDTFYNTPGLHTTACITTGLFRIYYIKIAVQQDKFESEPEPSVKTMGIQWFLVYATFISFIHNLPPHFL